MNMTQTFEERLNQILPRITSEDFLQNRGLGNEIGFWIFEYAPEQEMAVRSFCLRSWSPHCGADSRR
jgi:hypothetical protein